MRLRVGAFIRSLPDHRLLDRLIRGRWWIPVLGVMLAGIVAMQVEVLKLGASMGRSLERNSVLSSSNAELRQSVATLGDDQRIEQLAASMGMVMPPAQAVGFLAASAAANPGRALANIHEPSASSFLALTPANGEIVTADALAAANAPTSTTGSTSTIGSTSTAATTTPTSASDATTSAVAAAPDCPVVGRKLDRGDADPRDADRRHAHVVTRGHDELESGSHAVTDRRPVHGTIHRRRRRRSALDHRRGLSGTWRGSTVESASSSSRS